MRSWRTTGMGFLILAVFSVGAQSLGIDPQPTSVFKEEKSRRDALKLTTTIIGEKYCDGDQEVAVLHLVLRLRYTNITQDRIILLKNRSKAASILISRNLVDAAANHYEFEIVPDEFIFGRKQKPISGRVPDERFVVLEPNQIYETEATVLMGVPRHSTPPLPGGAVAPGEHVVQIRVHTWPESPERARTLRARWQKLGFLYTELITSDPMPFSVEKDPVVVDCSED